MTTPEERARADEITASVGRFVRQSQAVRIEGVSPEQPKNPDRWFRVGAIFALVLALHVAAFVGYRHYQDKQDSIKDQQRAELEAMRTDAAIAQAQARQLREALAAAQTPQWKHVGTYQPEPVKPTDYNVYKEPRPAPRPVYAPAPEPAPSPKPDRTAEHETAAVNYVWSKQGATVRTSETTQVPGWEGRYRTTGEALFYKYGTKTPSPRKFEVLTQEKSGNIIASDLTIKW